VVGWPQMERKWFLPGPAVWPLSLTLLRLVLGPVAILIAVENWPHHLFVPILMAGILSDYFDGVLARRFNVAFPWVRRLDSVTDVVFYLCILVSAWLVSRSTIVGGLVPVMVMVVGELVCHGVGLVKFKAVPAVHAISAKVYGLCVFIACLGVISYGAGPWMLWGLAVVSVIANGEIVVILVLSKEAPVDVLSIFHFRNEQARRARVGREPTGREAYELMFR
ncbi:MAG: CDP-alcohol phosphatidyltransferase family protein, partial [Verrucomicrobiales bacterium]|nr:CDP-alcohol phosphatidyltransferase family protein [Verrucomicrobiales bacterium]